MPTKESETRATNSAFNYTGTDTQVEQNHHKLYKHIRGAAIIYR